MQVEGESKHTRLTLMEEVLLLGMKDREGCVAITHAFTFNPSHADSMRCF